MRFELMIGDEITKRINKKINTAGGCPTAITNDLASVVCWVSQMASCFISYFSCLTKKSSQKKSPPVC